MISWKVVMFVVGVVSVVTETVTVAEFGDVEDFGLWLRYTNTIVSDAVIFISLCLLVFQYTKNRHINTHQGCFEHAVFILYEIAAITTFVNAPLIWSIDPIDIDQSKLSPFQYHWSEYATLTSIVLFVLDMVVFGHQEFHIKHLPWMYVGALFYFIVEVLNRLVFDVRAFERLDVAVENATLDIVLLFVWHAILTTFYFYLATRLTTHGPDGIRQRIQLKLFPSIRQIV
jgi:hypothetical protein